MAADYKQSGRGLGVKNRINAVEGATALETLLKVHPLHLHAWTPNPTPHPCILLAVEAQPTTDDSIVTQKRRGRWGPPTQRTTHTMPWRCWPPSATNIPAPREPSLPPPLLSTTLVARREARKASLSQCTWEPTAHPSTPQPPALRTAPDLPYAFGTQSLVASGRMSLSSFGFPEIK